MFSCCLPHAKVDIEVNRTPAQPPAETVQNVVTNTNVDENFDGEPVSRALTENDLSALAQSLSGPVADLPMKSPIQSRAHHLDDDASIDSILNCGAMLQLPATDGPKAAFNLSQSAAHSFRNNTGGVVPHAPVYDADSAPFTPQNEPNPIPTKEGRHSIGDNLHRSRNISGRPMVKDDSASVDSNLCIAGSLISQLPPQEGISDNFNLTQSAAPSFRKIQNLVPDDNAEVEMLL